MRTPTSHPARIEVAAHGGDLWGRLERPELADGSLYWLESTAPEGRTELLRRTPSGAVEVVSPSGVDVRGGVHEYGGGAYAVSGGAVVFAGLQEGRLFRIDAGGGAVPLTEALLDPEAVRYGDLTLVGDDVLCVRETHGEDGVVNELVRISERDGAISVIASGRDFYSFPCASSDGSQLAWTCWDHPGMPFLGCELWRADTSHGDQRRVAGGPSESIFQPQWHADGRLFYVSDRSGWWNLYVDGEDEPIGRVEAELGWPQWFLGLSSYTFLDDGRIAALVNGHGTQRLEYLMPDGAWQDAGLPHRHVAWPYLRGDGRRVAYIAAEADRAPELVLVDTDTDAYEVVRRSLDVEPPSRTQAKQIVVADGINAHVYLPPDTAHQPPLVVVAHGGPTDQAAGGLRLDLQLLTSCGYAVADVDYGGSTGYGRARRELLRGAWGTRDVEDCVAVARKLAADGAVDPSRMAIMGGSAGGYITLCALAFHDVFCAGISLYGIADPSLFDADTHKFESSYTGWLTGAEARSPARATSFSGPLLLLQGTDDRIVTPGHLREMVAAYRRAGVPVETLLLEGEGHGFRREESLLEAYSAIVDFLERAFALPHQGK